MGLEFSLRRRFCMRYPGPSTSCGGGRERMGGFVIVAHMQIRVPYGEFMFKDLIPRAEHIEGP